MLILLGGKKRNIYAVRYIWTISVAIITEVEDSNFTILLKQKAKYDINQRRKAILRNHLDNNFKYRLCTFITVLSGNSFIAFPEQLFILLSFKERFY